MRARAALVTVATVVALFALTASVRSERARFDPSARVDFGAYENEEDRTTDTEVLFGVERPRLSADDVKELKSMMSRLTLEEQLEEKKLLSSEKVETLNSPHTTEAYSEQSENEFWSFPDTDSRQVDDDFAAFIEIKEDPLSATADSSSSSLQPTEGHFQDMDSLEIKSEAQNAESFQSPKPANVRYQEDFGKVAGAYEDQDQNDHDSLVEIKGEATTEKVQKPENMNTAPDDVHSPAFRTTDQASPASHAKKAVHHSSKPVHHVSHHQKLRFRSHKKPSKTAVHHNSKPKAVAAHHPTAPNKHHENHRLRQKIHHAASGSPHAPSHGHKQQHVTVIRQKPRHLKEDMQADEGHQEQEEEEEEDEDRDQEQRAERERHHHQRHRFRRERERGGEEQEEEEYETSSRHHSHSHLHHHRFPTVTTAPAGGQDGKSSEASEDSGPVYILPLAPIGWATAPASPYPSLPVQQGASGPTQNAAGR